MIASLRADTALERVTDLAFQVHSVDPPHAAILRSIELVATEVAPALGWVRAGRDAATPPASRQADQAGRWGKHGNGHARRHR